MIAKRVFSIQAAALFVGVSLVLVVAALTLAVVILLGRQPVPSKPDTTTWYVRHLTQTGIASWYGPRFHRRKTASGEVFDQNQRTAAHRTLGFGTMVEVTHVKNGRSVAVRINDRGPFRRGRIIDVSRAAAADLGMKNAGLAMVKLRPLH